MFLEPMGPGAGLSERFSNEGISALLSRPVVDRTIAVAACIPVAVALWQRWSSRHLDFTRVALGLNVLVQILTLLARHPPKRLTPNPLFWLMAMVATYGMLFLSVTGAEGQPLAPVVSPLARRRSRSMAPIVPRHERISNLFTCFAMIKDDHFLPALSTARKARGVGSGGGLRTSCIATK